MDPLTIALILGGVSVLGSVFTGLSSFGLFGKKAQNAADTSLGLDSQTGDPVWRTEMQNNNIQAAEQRSWLEYMTDKQFQRSTPAAQMQMYREAGLNPALMYGQMTDLQTSVPAGAEGSFSGVPSSQFSSLLGLGSDLTSKIPSVAADIDLKRAQAEEIRSRIPLNDARVQQINTLIQDVQQQMKQRGLDISFSEQTLPSRVSAAIARNNFDEADAQASMKYVNELAEANYRQQVAIADNWEKQVLLTEAKTETERAQKQELLQSIKNMKEEFKSLKAKAEIDQYAAKNKEAGFWTDHIKSAWQLAGFGFGVIDKLADKYKGSSFEQGINNFSKQYNPENGIATPPYQ